MKKQWLAQLNISRILGEDMNDPIMADFVAQLDEVNALAEVSEGFVWRLKDEDNNATNFRPYDDDRIIINLSVWESVEDLERFAFNGRHVEVMRDRRKWFEKAVDNMVVLWHIDAGHTPSVQEAKERLEQLRREGASDEVFDFRYLKMKKENK
jgi:Domain of unknown function (DUF3291)